MYKFLIALKKARKIETIEFYLYNCKFIGEKKFLPPPPQQNICPHKNQHSSRLNALNNAIQKFFEVNNVQQCGLVGFGARREKGFGNILECHFEYATRIGDGGNGLVVNPPEELRTDLQRPRRWQEQLEPLEQAGDNVVKILDMSTIKFESGGGQGGQEALEKPALTVVSDPLSRRHLAREHGQGHVQEARPWFPLGGVPGSLTNGHHEVLWNVEGTLQRHFGDE